jgi:ATP adenylyltransferase
MGNPLWAPWRMEYVLSPKKHDTCVFCDFASTSEDERRSRFVVCVAERASVILNRYPFASGHLLIVPHAHVSMPEELDDADYDALYRLVRESSVRLRRAVRAEGLNIGVNLGAVAGAGIAEHLHVHIVPRWSGDTNFMPVLADARVVPQALDATRAHLEPFFADLAALTPVASDQKADV